MTTYVVGQITIKDRKKWEDYRSRLPATLKAWGAEVLMRGTNARVLSGQHPHNDTVVIQFPDMSSAIGWHDSPEYQALVPLRNQAADVDLVCYESDT